MRIVMKFGGTGVDSCRNLVKVSDLVTNYKNDNGYEIVVVVSAVRGVTDSILKLTDSINRHEKVSVQDILGKLSKTHLEIIEGCIHDTELRDLARDTIIKLLNDLKDVLGGMVILQEVTPKSLDYLLSFGERLSASMVYFALRDKGVITEFLTGKEAGIMTDSNFGAAKPLMDTTKLRVRRLIEPLLQQNSVPIVTGFIGADQNGNVTTLGRGGSDYTATIIAASINADETWLWTDVDGLMTADPRIAADAEVLSEVSFSEAMEMALFGAKYMHPRALEPVIENGIPVRIRNVMNPSQIGTMILQSPSDTSKRIVKSVSAIRRTGLIDVGGTAMAGAPGTAAKIFDALAKKNINIIMISQSPSESSISMVLRNDDIEKAISILELSLLGKVIKKVEVNKNVSVIAVVGSGMRGIQGVAARIFSAVARENVNVIMIAQGSSQLNLAFVVSDNDCESAIRALHKEFGLGKHDPNSKGIDSS
jgi:aspartate kinase